MKYIYNKINNPVYIFIISFILLSILGTLLLILPLSTNKKISFIDALFTSTSAVCVTGLSVINISKDLTYIGKIILLILIEIGGLGILTITSCVNYFFKKGFSFKEAIFIGSFLNSKTINNAFILAVKVVIFTILVECIGALLIYFSIIYYNYKLENTNLLFFSIFHSISSFCNSGFSIIENGLYSKYTKFNYFLQLSISFLFILGGIGFNIIFNFFTYIWLNIKKKFYKIFKNDYLNYSNYSEHINLNTQIVFFTTLLLLFIGTIFYYISEYNYSLKEHNSTYGKLIASFFSSATARTAGFNVINMRSLNNITTLFTIFLMWVGASPTSTGGGIKTSTLFLSIMNLISLSKGKNRLEIKGREIHLESIQLSFSIIMLSLIIIYLSILLIVYLEPKKDILSISFEVFSAFSTTGLSRGITQNLSNESKLVIILLMLFGRIGIFNIMIGIFRSNKINYTSYYKLPKEKIIIN